MNEFNKKDPLKDLMENTILSNLNLLDSKNDISDLTETLLFLAARAQLVKENLESNLEKSDKFIICDRYSDSTLAYQGYGKGVDITSIKMLNSLVTKGIVPTLTIVVDVSYDVSIKRRETQALAKQSK